MAHQPDSNVIETVVQPLCESGLSQMAEAVRIMLNEAMRIERSQVLEAGPYERNERRRGYANGFKPTTLETRLGAMTVQVPQTRAGWSSTPRRWKRACVASGHSSWPSLRVRPGRFHAQGDRSHATALRAGGVEHASKPRNRAAG